jgi:hypothetical protein
MFSLFKETFKVIGLYLTVFESKRIEGGVAGGVAVTRTTSRFGIYSERVSATRINTLDALVASRHGGESEEGRDHVSVGGGGHGERHTHGGMNACTHEM